MIASQISNGQRYGQTLAEDSLSALISICGKRHPGLAQGIYGLKSRLWTLDASDSHIFSPHSATRAPSL